MPLKLTRRATLCVSLGTLLMPKVTPAKAVDDAPWELFEPRAREFSRIRRRETPTVAIVFGNQELPAETSWERLTESERAAVRAIQPPAEPGVSIDEPPFPRVGLRPIIERLRVVRGPVGKPLRLYLEIDELGALSTLAVGGPVQQLFGHEMFGMLRDAAFKPGTCAGKACTSVLAMDIVYLGDR